MTMPSGDSSHVHLHCLEQSLFRATSLTENSSCHCYSMLRFKYRKGTKLKLKQIHMSLKLYAGVKSIIEQH